MQKSKKSSSDLSSISSLLSSNEQKIPISVQKSPSKTSTTSDYEYKGRLVTYERPVRQKSKLSTTNSNSSFVFPSRINKHSRLMHSKTSDTFDDEETEDTTDLTRPVGRIQINDRHVREIYRVPTPPPEFKQVFYRARSPEPKIIERIYVKRPAPTIIEKVIQVPPETVQIINKEKQLPQLKPTFRTRYVYLKPEDEYQVEERVEVKQEPQQEVTVTTTEQQVPATYVYSQPTACCPSFIAINSQPCLNPQPGCYAYRQPYTFFRGYSQF
ncbi:unnamed protein product [Adineta steineri]|uniref:Uncharacterized protein n=2 Tax=Adineta steineri TaxID=433720 RepID=A0A815HV35_9BILA|nr:unnamed protein product [Adineta steineri]CAF1355466.1 unnamed protein product [Adineta steineri]CAF3748088.1 unnamed protein product [Adineta steineri]